METNSTHPAASGPSITRSASRPDKVASNLTLTVTEASGLSSPLAALAVEDLPSALDSAKSQPRAERAAAVEAVLRAALVHHPEFVARELTNAGLPYSTMGEISTDLIRSWPDANKALIWANKNTTGVNRAPVVSAALARVVAKSPPDAASFIETMPPGSTRDDALRATIRAWASTDLQAAIHYAETKPDDSIAKAEVEWMYGTWAQKEPSAAEAFFMKTPDDARLGMMAALLALGRAHFDSPAAAMNWAIEIPGNPGERARKAAITEWSKTDPAAAALFVDQSDEKLQSELVPTLTSEWKLRDPAAATNWSSSRKER